MIHTTSARRRLAALASGALVAGGLVVAPAVAGLSAATAAPVSLSYTCSGAAAGQSFALPATVTIDVASPDAVAPGSDFSAAITAKLDMGSANFGPVTSLTGTTDFPVTVGSDSATFTTKSVTAPMNALVFNDSGSVNLTAPAAAGSAPITAGTIVGHLTADPYGIAFTSTCVPDAGQNLTIGNVNVTDGDPEPEGLSYTCVISGGPTPLNVPSVLTIDVDAPDTVTAGETFPADVDVELDMGDLYLGPVGGFTGALDLDFLVGDQASTGSVPIEPVTLVPSATNPVVMTGSGVVDLVAPADAGDADIAVGDLAGDLMANVFGTDVPNSIPCTADAGQDQKVGSIAVEQGEPVAVPVTGKVKVTGTPKVGKTLKATPGTSDGAKVTYKWLANGKAIKKATKPSLKLTKALQGKKVSVQATYAKDGFLKVVQTSKAVTVKKK